MLRDARHLAPAMDRHRKFAEPVGQYALDPALLQSEPVRVRCRKVADVQTDPGEACDLRHLPLCEEPVGYPTLIEQLDAECMQTARAPADEFLIHAPLDDRDVDIRQRQLTCQHQTCWTSSDDHHRMILHRCPPVAHTATARFYGMSRVLKQAPGASHIPNGAVLCSTDHPMCAANLARGDILRRAGIKSGGHPAQGRALDPRAAWLSRLEGAFS